MPDRFGPRFAGEMRRQRVTYMRVSRHWRRHLDESYVKLDEEKVFLAAIGQANGAVTPMSPSMQLL
ncbi:hypothetical protein KZ813_06540 [Sphingomonas sp. RHCKR7]|uniref:hypothetical protein n=1 Tax=Sphingomonas folli TaxID=2862497 RepID=UPI001CA56DBD|nr:hypothetical protein [Sphingomonas folli]MBW6526494.1 hypothetical protein [Sphingomonas folli]